MLVGDLGCTSAARVMEAYLANISAAEQWVIASVLINWSWVLHHIQAVERDEATTTSEYFCEIADCRSGCRVKSHYEPSQSFLKCCPVMEFCSIDDIICCCWKAKYMSKTFNNK